MKPVTDKKIYKSSIWAYSSKGINALLAFIFSVLIVKYLSPSDYGVYKLIFSIGTILTFAGSLGTQNTIARFVPEYIEKKQYLRVNTLLYITLSLRFLGVSLLLFFSAYFSDWIFEFFDLPTLFKYWYISICFILLLSQLYQVFGIAFLNACLEVKKDSLVQIVKSAIMVIMLLGVVLCNLGFGGIVLLLLITEMTTFTIYGILATRKVINNYRINRANNSSPTLFEYKRVRRFMIYSYAFTGMNVFRDLAVDNLVIAHYLGTRQVGLYTFAATFVSLVNFFNPGAILKPIFNYLLIQKYTQTNDRSHLIYGNRLIIKVCAFVTLPLFMTAGIMAEPIVIYIYSPEYVAAVPLIHCLTFFFSFRCIVQGIGLIINTLEIIHLRLFTIIFSLYNLVMDIILVKHFGPIGAAIATGSALLLTIIYYYIVVIFYAKIKLTFPYVSIIKIIFNLIIVALLLIYLKATIKDIFSLLVVLLSGAVMYFFLSYINKPFSKKDRHYINNMIGKQMWVF